MAELEIGGIKDKGEVSSLSLREQEEWRDFLKSEHVSRDLAERQLALLVENKQRLWGLTECQRLLSQGQYIGRGIEAVAVNANMGKDLNDKLLETSAALVREAFPVDPAVRKEDLPESTWRRALTRVMSGRSHFVEDESDSKREGWVGVFDAFVLYFARIAPHEPLNKSSIANAPLIGIHGVYHYLLEPEVYWGLRMAVRPDLQGRGLGTKLMSHNLHLCLELGATQRNLFTEKDPQKNKKALDLYRGLGFRETDAEIDYNGKQQTVLSLPLQIGSKGWLMAQRFNAEDGEPVSELLRRQPL